MQQLPGRVALAGQLITAYRSQSQDQIDALNARGGSDASGIDAAKYISDSATIFMKGADTFSGAVAQFANSVARANISGGRANVGDGLWVNLPQTGVTK